MEERENGSKIVIVCHKCLCLHKQKVYYSICISFNGWTSCKWSNPVAAAKQGL